MSVYIVTYDLNSPGQDYTSLIKAVEKYTHCKALKSAYFIDSAESASVVRDNLMKHVDRNDVIFVMELEKHWAANRVTAATEWLKNSSRSWS